jgi:hypothetical protein
MQSLEIWTFSMAIPDACTQQIHLHYEVELIVKTGNHLYVKASSISFFLAFFVAFFLSSRVYFRILLAH